MIINFDGTQKYIFKSSAYKDNELKLYIVRFNKFRKDYNSSK